MEQNKDLENTLFTGIERKDNLSEEQEKAFYDEVLESRKRPEDSEGKTAVTFPVLEQLDMDDGEDEEEITRRTSERRTYPYEEVISAATEYFNGDSLAANVWINKYALKNSDGFLFELTPDDMHWRLASEIARIETLYPNPMGVEEVFHLLKNFRYIVPQGGPMAGIGNDFQ